MRYELNFDEDKVNDVLVVGGASYDLKGCCDIMNEQQATINRLEEEIKLLKPTNVEQYEQIVQLQEENEQLKKENNDYEKQFRIINEKLDEYIKTADTYRIPISSLEYGDDLGYFNGVYQYMKKLKKDIGGIGYE